MGKYKVPHFDAKGEADHFFTDAGVPDDLPAHVVLLGQPHLLRHGAEEGPGRQAGAHAADGRQEAAGHRRRGHRQVRLRHLQAGREFIGKTVGIAGEHLTGAQMAAALTKALGQQVALQRRAARRLPQLRLPGRRRPGQHVPVQRDFEDAYCGARDIDASALAQPASCTVSPAGSRQRHQASRSARPS